MLVNGAVAVEYLTQNLILSKFIKEMLTPE